ncbi:MAG: glycosyltransferase, partial [Phycisphaerae bacterium]|nr:glycosyltransferase [Phycisphaerae bacterium]
FWRRAFGTAVGPLDETLFYTMDYDLWCRMGRRRDPLILDRVVGRFRFHGGSKSGAVDRRQFDEEYLVALRYLGNDRLGRLIHRAHVEKTVWSYRLMRLVRSARRS